MCQDQKRLLLDNIITSRWRCCHPCQPARLISRECHLIVVKSGGCEPLKVSSPVKMSARWRLIKNTRTGRVPRQQPHSAASPRNYRDLVCSSARRDSDNPHHLSPPERVYLQFICPWRRYLAVVGLCGVSPGGQRHLSEALYLWPVPGSCADNYTSYKPGGDQGSTTRLPVHSRSMARPHNLSCELFTHLN